MKLSTSVAAVLCTTLLAAGCSSSNGSDAGSTDAVTVGTLLSLTGTSAFSGIDAKQGIDLAVKELEAGILKDVDLKFEEVDDATDPNQSVTAMQRLLSDDVQVVIGGSISSIAAATAPIAARAKVPYVVVNSFAPDLTENGDTVFQVSRPTTAFNIALAEQVKAARGVETAAILYGQDVPTTVAFRDDYLAGFKEAGIEVVGDEGARSTDADFTTAIRKVMQKKPDALVTLFPGAVDGLVVKQVKSLGFDPMLIGHVGDVGEAFTKAAGSDGVGILANTGFLPTGTSEELQKFVEDFKAEYDGEVPAATEAQGYQAMMLLGRAIANVHDAGKSINSESIQTAMNDLGEQPSVLGSTGTAQFEDRVFSYDGFMVELGPDLSWSEWAQ